MNINQDAKDLYIDLLKKTLTASIYGESAWEIVGSQIDDLKKYSVSRLLSKVLHKKDYLLIKKKKFNLSERKIGKDWPCFGYTMTGHLRLDNIQNCVEDVLTRQVPGDFIETGVWRGGATIFMRALLKLYGIRDRNVWVADSFQGLPVPRTKSIGDEPDLSHLDYLKVSLEEVKGNFEKFGLLDDQVKFLQGWFCDTLPNAPIDQLAILRLDGDLYDSTLDSLRSLYHKVSKGGYVIIDDYNSWITCRKAVMDFFEDNPNKPDIKPIDWSAVYWQV